MCCWMSSVTETDWHKTEKTQKTIGQQLTASYYWVCHHRHQLAKWWSLEAGPRCTSRFIHCTVATASAWQSLQTLATLSSDCVVQLHQQVPEISWPRSRRCSCSSRAQLQWRCLGRWCLGFVRDRRLRIGWLSIRQKRIRKAFGKRNQCVENMPTD